MDMESLDENVGQDQLDTFALAVGIGLGVVGVALLIPATRRRLMGLVDSMLPELRDVHPYEILHAATSAATKAAVAEGRKEGYSKAKDQWDHLIQGFKKKTGNGQTRKPDQTQQKQGPSGQTGETGKLEEDDDA